MIIQKLGAMAAAALCFLLFVTSAEAAVQISANQAQDNRLSMYLGNVSTAQTTLNDSVSTLTQKVLELIHGMGITGQEVTALQCLHGDSPLG